MSTVRIAVFEYRLPAESSVVCLGRRGPIPAFIRGLVSSLGSITQKQSLDAQIITSANENYSGLG